MQNTGRVIPFFVFGLMVAAALLFNVQPMIGKMLLPRVGGSPAVWNIVLAFFQLALLTGYLIAHGLGKLPIRLHIFTYIGLLIGASTVLPVSLPATWQLPPEGSAPFALLSLLGQIIALPFIALAATAPTLQRLFAASQHTQADDPYFLYAASNAGSFIGLLAFPLLLEPMLTTSAQTQVWQQGYYVLIAVVILCAFVAKPGAQKPSGPPSGGYATPQGKTIGAWLLLALAPSSLTSGITTHITTDIMATPLLWVITLGLYLLSFIIAFAKRGERLRLWALNNYLWLAALALGFFITQINSSWISLALELFGFFIICLACHTVLAHLRPAPIWLTHYYLWMAVGGALGGAFNAFLAPLIFNRLYEYPAALLLAVVMLARAEGHGAKQASVKFIFMMCLCTLLALLSLSFFMTDEKRLQQLLVLSVAATYVIYANLRPTILVLGYVAFLLVQSNLSPYDNIHFRGRDFFGVITVRENSKTRERTLEHGTTVHGVEIFPVVLPLRPNAYYARASALGLLWETLRPTHVAAIGLGTGAINCYAQPGQKFRFFEIDPLMLKVAQNEFTFLSDCPTPDVVLGDGRLMLAKDTGTYDLIVLDAFSSDSVPVHLLTREAFKTYLSKLTPRGALAVHISSRMFDLEPVLAAAAADLGLEVYKGTHGLYHEREEKDVLAFASLWVVLGKAGQLTATLAASPQNWQPLTPQANFRIWTDDFSNLIKVLKLPQLNASE